MKIIIFQSLVLLISTLVMLGTALADPSNTVSKTISIDEVVEQVLQFNPELKFFEEEIRVAKGEGESSGLLDNPELETSLGRKRDLSREGTAWSVSVVQSFEFPGRLSLRKAIANRQVKLAELGLKRFKVSLAAEARQSAYELLAAQLLLESAREVSSREQELVSVLLQRDPAGVTPLLETRIIEASIISLQKSVLDAERDAQKALFKLNQLMNAPLSNSVKISSYELQLPHIPDVKDLILSALESNFDLRMKQEELKTQGFRVELAKNERYPGFKVGPFYSEEKASEKEQIAGLGISVPLPIWNQNSGAITAAQARESQARTSMLLAQREVEQAVRENASEYERKFQEIQRWRPNIVRELKESAALGDRHYRLGAISVSTYVELQNQYIAALEAILSIQQEALGHLQALETVTGKALRDTKAKQVKESKVVLDEGK